MPYHPSAFCDRRRQVAAIFLSIGLAVSSLVVPWVASSAGGASPTPTTSVGIPSNGATLSGSTYLDAYASNATSVKFLLFGGSYGYAAPVVCTASPTIYGWLCGWDTTTVPNGSYVLVSEAFNSAGSTFSSGVGVTVDNMPLHTQVLVPSGGATVGGNVVLDASAEGTAPITGVTFTATQGSTVDTVGTGTPTPWGWIAQWASGVSPNNGILAYQSGTWSIQSVATEVGGTTATSSPVLITLVTLEDLQSSSFFIVNGGGGGTYSGSTSVGTVSFDFGFTLTTDVGSVSGPTALVTENTGTNFIEYLYALQVTTGTGLFTGTTGDSLFLYLTVPDTGPPSTGSVNLNP